MRIGYMLYRTGDATDLIEQIEMVDGFNLDELAFHTHPGTPGKWGGFDAIGATEADLISLESALSGYTVDIHAPISVCNDLDSSDKAARMGAIAAIVKTIECAARLSGETVTIHPGRWCVSAKSGTPSGEQVAIFSESLVELDRHAATCGVMLGMESTSHFDLPTTLSLRNVGLTIDVGHMMFGRESVADGNNEIIRVIDQFGSSIVHMHVHDFRPDMVGDEDHWPVGRGVIDYVRIVDALNRANFTGSLCLELGLSKPSETLPVVVIAESVEHLRGITR